MVKRPTFREISRDYFDRCFICFNIFSIAVLVSVILFIKSYKYLLTPNSYNTTYYVLVLLIIASVGTVLYAFVDLVLLPFLRIRRRLIREANGDS